MKENRVLTVLSVLAVAAAFSGCLAGDDQGVGFDEQAAQRNGDLTIGAVGDEVRALHDYLTKYGYFPNAELALQYPSWVPVVADAPSKSDGYDNHTAEAVRQLQVNSGLAATGVFDSPTRKIIGTPRCGVPDSAEDAAGTRVAHSKFALNGYQWGKKTLTYKLTNTNDVTLEAARAAVRVAFSRWSDQTDVTFNEVTGSATADIVITFAYIDGPGRTLAQTWTPYGTTKYARMSIDTSETWSADEGWPPSGVYHLISVVAHEIGHAIGLDHSSVTNALMSPGAGPGFAYSYPQLDDKVGISKIYDGYVQVTGLAKDIAIGADGSIWIIGTNAWGAGYMVHKWNGSGWDANDGGAVRIAVDPNGIPWLVDSGFNVWRHSNNRADSGYWEIVPGLYAMDIGIGANGDVWAVGIDVQPYKWNGSSWARCYFDGGVFRVTVGPAGVPWVIKGDGKIYRRTTNLVDSGTWENLGNNASDIAISSGNYAMSVENRSGSIIPRWVWLWVWDEQSAYGGAPAVKKWIGSQTIPIIGNTATNMSVAVDPAGKPWIVDPLDRIYTARK